MDGSSAVIKQEGIYHPVICCRWGEKLFKRWRCQPQTLSSVKNFSGMCCGSKSPYSKRNFSCVEFHTWPWSIY